MYEVRKFLSNKLCFIICGLLLCTSVENVNGADLNISNEDWNYNFVEETKSTLSNQSDNEVEFKSDNMDIRVKCLSDGKKTALEVNELKDNKKEFKEQVRAVLNEYYSTEKSKRQELEKFVENIDDSAKQIVENYQEAEEERENQDNLDYEVGKVIVSFPYGTSMETIDKIMEKEAIDYEIVSDGETHIAEDLPEYKKKRLEAIKDWKSDIVVEADATLEDTVKRAEKKLEKYDCVKSASNNTFFEADGSITTSYTATTDDPKFNENTQWNLLNVDVPRAWNKFKTVFGFLVIRIAVIDCGVQMGHKELSGALMKNKSVDVTQNNKKLIDCKDEQSATGQYTSAHGTSVAGILAAEGNNKYLGAGIASIANTEWKNSFEIMAIKCDKTFGADRHITKNYLTKAIDYAVNNGAEVINISYSAEKSDYDKFSELETSIKKAIAANVCVVCSAGNDSSTKVRYPAGFSGVIGVGATWKNGKLTKYSNESSAVDIVAPGGYSNSDGAQMFVTSPTTINSNGYRYSYGTSYATPHVSGTVAMMLSIHYGLTPAQILYRLQSRSTETVTGRIDTSKKYKFLNTGKSVELMKEE